MPDDLRARVAKAVLETAPRPCSNCLDDASRPLYQLALLVDAVMDALESGPQPEPDLAEWMQHQPTGVYRLFWHRGGCSVAAVGMLSDGSRWYAPANWTSSDADGVASADWSPVKSAELIESYQGSRRKRPRKGAPNV